MILQNKINTKINNINISFKHFFLISLIKNRWVQINFFIQIIG